MPGQSGGLNTYYTNMHPTLEKLLKELTIKCRQDGFAVRVIEKDRSAERQATLYNQGRTTDGAIVTHARAYESAHNYGLAVDVTPLPTTDLNWQRLRLHAKHLGFGVIGEWDRGHLQHASWPGILNLLRRTP